MSKKKKKKALTHEITVTPGAKKPFNWRLALALAGNTIIIFSVYRLTIKTRYFKIVLGIYMALTAIISIAYVIYNRGFSRKGVTPDMLPDTMSAEEKCEFIADAERRLKKSKWMLTLLFPFIVTFAYDLVELFFLDRFVSFIL